MAVVDKLQDASSSSSATACTVTTFFWAFFCCPVRVKKGVQLSSQTISGPRRLLALDDFFCRPVAHSNREPLAYTDCVIAIVSTPTTSVCSQPHSYMDMDMVSAWWRHTPALTAHAAFAAGAVCSAAARS
eukprot:scaffold11131_cov45-Phaeocystis_antarctica.AAC.2